MMNEGNHNGGGNGGTAGPALMPVYRQNNDIARVGVGAAANNQNNNRTGAAKGVAAPAVEPDLEGDTRGYEDSGSTAVNAFLTFVYLTPKADITGTKTS